MVTDEQHRKLQERVTELENKLASLSLQFSTLLMRRDAVGEKTAPKQELRGKRDVTRYRFEGKLLCKRRLVLECVKRLVVDKAIHDQNVLQTVFPDHIQGSLGIIKPVQEAERYSDAHHRFFFSDADIISIGGVSCAVCSQWDVKNISGFINLMRNHGYSIDVVERNV